MKLPMSKKTDKDERNQDFIKQSFLLVFFAKTQTHITKHQNKIAHEPENQKDERNQNFYLVILLAPVLQRRRVI